jgi:2C-methyl-D-erythritol 2,4-cyclodiphosphate synthase
VRNTNSDKVPHAQIQLSERRNNLCDLVETHPSCVNVKAKTHEKVDSIGEERSIACHTVVSLLKDGRF